MIINCGLIVILLTTEKFWQLCDLAINAEGEEKEIVAGWYSTEDGQTTSVAHWLEEDDFRKNGGVMNHETLESISSVQNLSRLTTQVLDG